MTRKDYILIAEVLRVEFNVSRMASDGTAFNEYGEKPQTVLSVASELADALKLQNPRFSREHFLAVVRGEKDLNSRPARRKS